MSALLATKLELFALALCFAKREEIYEKLGVESFLEILKREFFATCLVVNYADIYVAVFLVRINSVGNSSEGNHASVLEGKLKRTKSLLAHAHFKLKE